MAHSPDGNSSGEEGWGPHIQRNIPSTPAGEPPTVGRIPHGKTVPGFRRLLAELASAFEEQAAELSLAMADASDLRDQLRDTKDQLREAKSKSPRKVPSRAGSMVPRDGMTKQMTHTLDVIDASPVTALHTEPTEPPPANRRFAAARKLSRATSRIAAPMFAFQAAETDADDGVEDKMQKQDSVSQSELRELAASEAGTPLPLPTTISDDFPGEPNAAVIECRRMSNASRVSFAAANNRRRGSRVSYSRASSSEPTMEDDFLVGEFQLRPEWAETHLFRRLRRYGQSSARLQSGVEEETPVVHQRVGEHEYGCMRHFISFPASRFRVAWDIIGATLIIYDLIVIPLRAFEFPENRFVTTMDWVTLVFWTVNIIASVLVGYVSDGHMVMNFRMIVKNYFRSWFCIDLLVVMPDWFFTLYAFVSRGNSDSFSSVKLLRMVRLARTIRLLRLFKLRWLLQSIDELLDSEFANIISNIVKMIFALLAVNHFLACGWYLCAFLQEGTHQTWLEYHGHKDRHWGYQYLTSLHWSLTQFTPASMDVQPHNTLERTFAISVVVFALVIFSYLVGSITGSLTQLRSLKEEASKQFFQLRHFLRQKKIDKVHKGLSVKIEKYLEHAWQRQQDDMSVKSVKLLDLLSEQLFRELQSALYVPPLLIHPLFALLNKENSVTMHRLANTAVSQKHFASQDNVFFPSEVARHVYFVRTGRLLYRRVDQWEEECSRELVDADEDWIAEPIFWTSEWRHLGTLSTQTEASLILIEAFHFCDIMQMNPNALNIVVGYAQNFMKWFNTIDKKKLSDITQGEDVTDTLRTFLKEEVKDAGTKPPNRSMTSAMPGLGSKAISRVWR